MVWGAAAILSTGTLFLALAIRHLDIHEFDEILESKARTLAALVLYEHGFENANMADATLSEAGSEKNDAFFQFRLLDGTGVLRSSTLGENDLPFNRNAAEAPVFRNLRLPDGRRGRFVQIGFDDGDSLRQTDASPHANRKEGTADPRIALTFAQSREKLDALLTRIYLSLAAVDVLLVGLIALLIHVALNKGLQPLAHLKTQLAHLGPDKLATRIHLPQAPSEIAEIPVLINSFMEALQAAATREQRFTSDVAHELRTPVAEFRAACEVGARWSDDPNLVRKRFENLKDSALNMERMLEGLLELSRMDRGAPQIRVSAIHVHPLVNTCWSRVCPSGDRPRRRLDNRISRDLTLDTDPVILEQIVFNLLDNAASHSPPDSTVACDSAQTQDGACELRFCNPAGSLAPEDLTHIFERFWRKDAARTGGSHSGLGLSIVQSLANAIGVQTSAELAIDGIFSFTLRFPAENQSSATQTS